jgi:hypothetical protein
MMNMRALFEAYTQLMQNPAQFLQKHGIPQQFSGSSQDAIQYLMNNGKVSQEMYNDANNQLKQLQNNPLFRRFFNR